LRSSTASEAQAQAQVVVIGAGPSGLFAAAELARYGVPARVVEREPVPHRQARATALQPGTLEILARAELIDAVLAASVHLECARVFDSELRQVGELAFAGVGCPWEFQCSLPQWRTEQILAERLLELGGVVERGVTAASLEERDDGVLVRLERADGTAEVVEAAWIIGAGGAHSVTRASMAETLGGATYPGHALVAEVRVRCDLPRDSSNLVAAPEGYVLLAPLPEQRWITFVGDLDKGETERLASATRHDAVAAAIDRRVAADIAVEDVRWAAPFRMHRRVVSRLAQGRRFLLGDAGHLSSPFGGEGLNAGLHDAHDLAWKLALCLRGRGRPTLLESFEPERLAADHHVLEVSDRADALVRGAVESARTGVRRSPASPTQLAALARSRCMLDISYAASPLVGEYRGSESEPRAAPGPGDRYPDRTTLGGTTHHVLLFGAADDAGVARLRHRWRGLVDVARATGDPRRAGLTSSGAVLVRPDGYIGFRAVPADMAGVAALDAHLESYLTPA
jgi:6-methylpretetramide 4-monooxygenase / 4-hydroxy-6-methylpretetramide 12a-monooxygenase